MPHRSSAGPVRWLLSYSLPSLLLLASCERSPQTNSTTPPAPPPSQPEPQVPSPTATAGASGIDWSSVTAAPAGSGAMAARTLARYCDAWHRGKKPVITLSFKAEHSVCDDAGNSVKFSAELLDRSIWKEVVVLTRRGFPDGSKFAMAAAKSSFYANQVKGLPTDKFGVLPRYMYTIEVVDDETLRFHNDRKMDNGN